MRRIHFDSHGRVNYHYPFWQPWGCLGCLGRVVAFLVLLALFLFLLSQFRSCSPRNDDSDYIEVDTVVVEPVNGVPPIHDNDIIDDNGRRIVNNRLNVLFKAEVGQQKIEEWKSRFAELYPGDEYRVVFCDINTKLLAIEVPSNERTAIMAALPTQIPDIPFIVFEEEVMDMGYTPNDPDLRADASWHLTKLKAFEGWDYTMGDDVVTVAVVDSYFDLANAEFTDSLIVSAYNVVDGSDNVGLPSSYNPGQPDPVLCHGTMVANLAVGAADNAKGSAGIAPRCSFMPVSLGARFGCLAMLQGLLYAINHGAQVINISAGLSLADEVSGWSVERQIDASRRLLLSQETVWKYVFDMCSDYQVTIVWAAGNENVFTALDASKRGQNTIKVSAVDSNLNKADFSNFGNFADRNIYESTVSAPGVQVYGALPGSGFSPVDGTSFAAPIVAGTVGLMKSLDLSLTTAEIIDILKETGRNSDSPTIGPVIQIAPALDRVVDGFLPYDSLMAIAKGELNPYDQVYPTTLMRPIRLPEGSDTTVLPPLVQIKFRFAGGNRGKIYYTPKVNPSNQWVGDIELKPSADGRTIIIEQAADAVAEGENPFKPAKFTVIADSRGKCKIEKIESESVPATYQPFIKKHS